MFVRSINVIRILLWSSTLLCVAPSPGFAQNLPNLQIVSMKFVNRLEAMGAVWTTPDSSKLRGAIVPIRTNIPTNTPIWNSDLALAYKRNGEADWSHCLGFGLGAQASPGGGPWMLGETEKLSAGNGTGSQQFFAFCPVENDVTQVELLQMRATARPHRMAAR